MTTLEYALTYLDAGLSVVPIRTDGTKAPPDKWKVYQSRQATPSEVRGWAAKGYGLAVVGGAVSGNLELIDFETVAVFEAWTGLVVPELPGLLHRLTVVHTPGADEAGGRHVWARCSEGKIPGSTKLAFDSGGEILIETRGEGGYALVPGCPPACHPSGRTYRQLSGPPIGDCVVTGEERSLMLQAALALGVPRREDAPAPAQAPGGNLSPGDDFDRRATWPQVLGPRGWTVAGTSGNVTLWRRPGKSRGWSATTGHCHGARGEDLLYVFSSNAHPFGFERCYGKFRAFALLNHGGDSPAHLSAAAKQLVREGYGEGRGSRPPVAAPGSSAPAPLDGSAPPVLGLVTTCLSAIEARPVHWLVPKRIPLGKLVMIFGDGGHGKSRLTLDAAADLSRGRPLFGLDYPAPPPCDTLLISCEDGWGDTIVPRLLAADADLSRIHRVDGVQAEKGEPHQFDLACYQQMKVQLRRYPEIRLVVIDPAGAYVGRTHIDDHKDSELRSLLDPLCGMAEQTNVTIMLVKHMNRNAGARAIHRVSGSSGYANTVRAVFAVVPDRDDDDVKLLLPAKFNLGPWPSGLMLRMASLPEDRRDAILGRLTYLDDADRAALGEQLFRVEWLGETDVGADDAMGDPGRGPSKVAQCVDWLKAFLADCAYPTEEILAAAVAAGFSKDNVFRAQAALKASDLRSCKTGYQGKWWWGFGDPNAWTLRPTPPLSES